MAGDLKFEMPESVLEAFPPDERGLLDWARVRVSDFGLERIARCDNGCDFEENLKGLVELREAGDAGERFDWVPGEVLGLWSYRDKSEGDYSAVLAIFVCAALLRQTDGNEITEGLLGRLLDATEDVDDEALEAVARFIVFVMERDGESLEAMSFWGFALLVMVDRLGRDDLKEELGEWMVGVDAEARATYLEWMGKDVGTFLRMEDYLRVAPWRDGAKAMLDSGGWGGEMEELLQRIVDDPFEGEDGTGAKVKSGLMIGLCAVAGFGFLAASYLKKKLKKKVD